MSSMSSNIYVYIKRRESQGVIEPYMQVLVGSMLEIIESQQIGNKGFVGR